ncbi:aspartate carbamoyltransferase catalytic subunit [Oceanicola sp. 22II-s10i]|uniref:aspartate carbamoyltransferase catalytic subunit n=1 Tax=Oceanicola sp. 22II-s10i TaxID=1317116 RepID=UPI000B525E3D|nr:aspartate carbamoyltransferase catalytic subunit [Oceanicola sp. 22II-s10i]OWU85446.1 aspartate carbamoyltransferase catalytic subunit [Oceanicola sp. 22II-s10i]
MSRDLSGQATGDGWEGILDPDEVILWQGRPDATVRVGGAQIFGMIFGLFFAGFAAVWMMLASTAGGYFWMFGLLHFFVGLSVAFGSIVGPPWRRRHTWYTLTDRRAFIATDMPLWGRKLKAYPIDTHTPLSIDEDGDLATVNFAHEYRQNKNGSRRVDIGFERIPDGRVVLAKMREIQEDAA